MGTDVFINVFRSPPCNLVKNVGLVAMFPQIPAEVDVIQRDVIYIPVARGKRSDEDNLHQRSSSGREFNLKEAFSNTDVSQREVAPPVEGVSKVEQNREEDSQKGSQKEKYRPLQSSLKEGEQINAPAGHQPEKPTHSLNLHNLESARFQQVGDTMFRESKEIIRGLMDFPLVWNHQEEFAVRPRNARHLSNHLLRLAGVLQDDNTDYRITGRSAQWDLFQITDHVEA